MALAIIIIIVLGIVCISQHSTINRLRSELDRYRQPFMPRAGEVQQYPPQQQDSGIPPSVPTNTQGGMYGNMYQRRAPQYYYPPDVGQATYVENIPSAEPAPDNVPAEQIQYEQPYLPQPEICPEQQSADIPAPDAENGSFGSPYQDVFPMGSYNPLPPVNTAPAPSVNPINAILVLGALFITIAGFVFAAAAWGNLSTFFKSVMLLSFSAVFYAISALTEKKLNLPTSAKVFYALGSAFLPAAVAAAGFLQVFGEYYSFSGGGMTLLCGVMCILLSVSTFIGCGKFSGRRFADVGFVSLSAAVVFISCFAAPEGWVAALAMAVYSLAALIAEPAAVKALGASPAAKAYSSFASVNVLIMALISPFFSAGGFFIIPSLAFSAALFITSSRKSSPVPAYGFGIYLMLSMLISAAPDSLDSGMLVSSLVMVVYTVLSMMSIIPDGMKTVMRRIGSFFFGLIILIGMIDYAGDEPTITMVISAAAVFIQTLIINFRSANTPMRIMSSASFVWLALSTSGYIPDDDVGIIVFSLAAAAWFILVKLTPLSKRLYTRFSDVLTLTALFISFFVACFSMEAETILSIFVLAHIAAFISGRDSVIGRIAAPMATSMSVLVIASGLFGDFSDFDSVIIGSIFSIAVSCVMLLKPLKRFTVPYAVLAVLSALACLISEEELAVGGMAAATVYAALFMLSRFGSKQRDLYGQLFLGALCVTLYKAGLVFSEPELALFYPCAVIFILLAVFIFPDLKGTAAEIITGKFLNWAMPVIAIAMAVTAEDVYFEPFPGRELMIMAGVLTVFTAVVSCIRGNMIAEYIVLPLVLIRAMFLVDHIALAIIAPIVLMAAGRLLFRDRIAISADYADIFSISAFIPPLWAIICSDDVGGWMGMVLCAAAVLNLLRRDQKPGFRRGVLIAAAVMIMPVWWFQPFFEMPDLIITEWNLIPAAVFCIAVRFIHTENRSASETVSFITAIISLLILFFDAADTELAADAVILGCVIAAMLAFSFARRQKRWFVLSVVSAAAEALILTMMLHDSRAWWVYLLIAGAALIGVGISNEYRKQHSDESSRSSFMSGWRW